MANGFNEIGFLGDDLEDWAAAVRAEFPESFINNADRMNRIGMRMIYEFPEGDFPEERVLAIAGLYRAMQSYQSIILLTEKGTMAEARALARLCCEAVIVTGGLLKVKGTVEKLNEENANLISMKDVDGSAFIKGMIDMVKASGKGWYEPYKFTNPKTQDYELKSRIANAVQATA